MLLPMQMNGLANFSFKCGIRKKVTSVGDAKYSGRNEQFVKKLHRKILLSITPDNSRDLQPRNMPAFGIRRKCFIQERSNPEYHEEYFIKTMDARNHEPTVYTLRYASKEPNSEELEEDVNLLKETICQKINYKSNLQPQNANNESIFTKIMLVEKPRTYRRKGRDASFESDRYYGIGTENASQTELSGGQFSRKFSTYATRDFGNDSNTILGKSHSALAIEDRSDSEHKKEPFNEFMRGWISNYQYRLAPINNIGIFGNITYPTTYFSQNRNYSKKCKKPPPECEKINDTTYHILDKWTSKSTQAIPDRIDNIGFIVQSHLPPEEHPVPKKCKKKKSRKGRKCRSDKETLDVLEEWAAGSHNKYPVRVDNVKLDVIRRRPRRKKKHH